MKRRIIILLTLVLSAFGLYGAYHFWWQPLRRARPDSDGGAILRELAGIDSVTTEVNAKAPAFAAKSLDGSGLRSIDFIGQKVLLLEFWSVFCASCIQEMPFLDELHRKYKDQGLEVVGVNTDYFGIERIRRFFDKLEPRPTYQVIHDQSQEISKNFHVEALPVTVLIDSSGWIRMYHLGYKPDDRKTIENIVAKWLGKIRDSVETVKPIDGKTPVVAPGQATIKVGTPLPELSAADETGRVIHLKEYAQKRPMAIFFWSLFCQPCRQEMPALSSLAGEMAEKRGVVFLSVNIDTPQLSGQVKRLLSRKPLTFTTLLDASTSPPGLLTASLGVGYTPTLILVSAEGIVSRVMVGEVSSGELREQVLELTATSSGGG